MTDEFKDISEARLIKPNGKEIIVQTGGPLRPGNVRYDHGHMEGDLKCLCCDAPSRYKPSRASKAGSSAPSNPSHFAVTRHKKDCVDYLRYAGSSAQSINRKKGYRIHLNTMAFSDAFNKEAGAYDVSPKGRITISDPDLRDRESFAVNDLKELIKFMNWADPERLKDSVVIFRNKKLEWNEFFIDTTSDPQAVAWLTDSAKARKKDEVPPFALLKVETQKSFVQHQFGKSEPVPMDPLDAGLTKANRQRLAHMRIYLDERSWGVTWAFHQEKHYLVMGVVRAGDAHKETGKLIEDWLHVKIADSRQIEKMKFIENTAAPSHGKAAKAAPSGP